MIFVQRATWKKIEKMNIAGEWQIYKLIIFGKVEIRLVHCTFLFQERRNSSFLEDDSRQNIYGDNTGLILVAVKKSLVVTLVLLQLEQDTTTTSASNYFTVFKTPTWRGCSCWMACLSAAMSQRAGGARPVSDSFTPDNSFTWIYSISWELKGLLKSRICIRFFFEI